MKRKYTTRKNIVVTDLEAYNAIQETLHLTSSTKNHERLVESIQEMNDGKVLPLPVKRKA